MNDAELAKLSTVPEMTAYAARHGVSMHTVWTRVVQLRAEGK